VALIVLLGSGPEPVSALGNPSGPRTTPTTAPVTIPTTPTTAPTTAPSTAPTTAPTSAPTTAPSTTPTTSPSTPPSTTPTTQPSGGGGSAVSLGNGLSVTPASGWTVDPECNPCNGWTLGIFSPDQISEVYFQGAKADSTDPATDLNDLVAQVTSNSSNFTNVHTGTPTITSLSSNPAGFTSFSYVVYEGTLSETQGTEEVYGVFEDLLDTPGSFSMWVDYVSSSSNSLVNNQDAAAAMVASIGDS